MNTTDIFYLLDAMNWITDQVFLFDCLSTSFKLHLDTHLPMFPMNIEVFMVCVTYFCISSIPISIVQCYP